MKLRKSLFVLSVNLLITLALAEFVCRALQKGTSYSDYTSQAATGYYEYDQYNSFKLQKSYSGSQVNQDRNLKGEPQRIDLSTNSSGFRTTINYKPSHCRHTKKVLFLGDSYTFGTYLRDRHTIPSQFAKIAYNKSECLSIVNAGYANGHESDQIHAWLYQNIEKIKPDYVIYNIFAGNDIWWINKASWQSLNNDGLPTKWINKDLMVLNGRIKDQTDRPPLYLYYIPILRELKSLAFIEQRLKPYLAMTKLHMFQTGYLPQAFAHLSGNYSGYFLDQESTFYDLTLSMNRLSEKNQAKFLAVYIPTNFEVYPSLKNYILPSSRDALDLDNVKYNYGERLCNNVRAHSISCLNLAKHMSNAVAQSEEEIKQLLSNNYLFPAHGEIHFSKTGAEFAAAEIFAFWKNSLTGQSI